MDADFLGFLGGLLGGLFAAVATVWVYARQNRLLEEDEIRKRKVDIIFRLVGSRYVLDKDYPGSPEEVKHFNTSMSQLSVYFSKDKAVMDAFDSFMINPNSDEKLMELLVAAAASAQLDIRPSQMRSVYYRKPTAISAHNLTSNTS